MKNYTRSIYCGVDNYIPEKVTIEFDKCADWINYSKNTCFKIQKTETFGRYKFKKKKLAAS